MVLEQPGGRLPSLARLAGRARDLADRCRGGDPQAIATVLASARLGPRSAGAATSPLKLSDAQLAVAQAYGFSSWGQLKAHFDKPDPRGSTAIQVDPARISDLNYRRDLAARLGFPRIGTSRQGKYGVRYTVVDYGFFLSSAGVAQANGNAPTRRLDESRPLIEFTNLSPPLRTLLDEVDRCTSKRLLFFDTVPELNPGTAAEGLCQVIETSDPACLAICVDAARLHETVLAHELGHIRVAVVDGCEDYRNLRDLSNVAKVSQFGFVQSFVLDLLVNDFIEGLGFDMSVISNDQIESVQELAARYARCERFRSPSAEAAMALTLAGAILEQRRWPKGVALSMNACLDVIRATAPQLQALADAFVRIVQRHAYSDSAAIRNAVSECAVLYFTSIGENFEPDRDLVDEPPTAWMYDKYPEFMRGLPVQMKLEAFRAIAKNKIDPPWRLVASADRLGPPELQFRGVHRPDRTVTPTIWPTLPNVDCVGLLKGQILPGPRRAPNAFASPFSRSQAPVTVPTQALMHPFIGQPFSGQPPSPPQNQAAPIIASSQVPMAPPTAVTHAPATPAALPPTYCRRERDPAPVRLRRYMAGLGRWMSRDPIGYDGGDWNLYRYVGNKPTLRTDPSGLQTPACLPVCGPCLSVLIASTWVCHDCGLNGPCWAQCIEDIENRQLYT